MALIAGPLSPQVDGEPQLSQPATEVIVNPCAWDGVGTRKQRSPITQAVRKDLAILTSARVAVFHLALLKWLSSPGWIFEMGLKRSGYLFGKGTMLLTRQMVSPSTEYSDVWLRISSGLLPDADHAVYP